MGKVRREADAVSAGASTGRREWREYTDISRREEPQDTRTGLAGHA